LLFRASSFRTPLLLLLLLPPGAHASETSLATRRTWLDPESLGPEGEGNVSTVRLGWNVPLGRRIRLEARLPLAFVDIEELVWEPEIDGPQKVAIEGQALGNPYLGLDLPARKGEARFHLGLWLPVAPGYGRSPEGFAASVLAMGTEVVRNAEDYVPDALAVGAGVYHDHIGLGPALLGLRGDLRGWYPVDDRDDFEFFLLVGVDLSPWQGDWAPTLFTDGRWSSGGGESWFQVAGLGLEGSWGPVRPRLEASLPVNPVLRQLYHWSLQGSVTVDLP
jgi:hypothetical protein